MRSHAQILSNYLKKQQLTIAFAESVTCGLAINQLGNVSRTSDFLKGGIVCYDEEVKTGLLKVKPALIKKYTAESQEVTDALAKNLNTLFNADVCVAITGLASPGGSETPEKPVGTIFFSVYYKRKIHRKQHLFKGSPLQIKKKASAALYDFIARQINNQ